MQEEYVFLNCGCRSADHVIRFMHGKFEGEPPYLAVDVQLNHYLPFWQRVKAAVRYIFGGESPSFGHWDSVMLEQDQVDQLFVLCQHSRAARSKYEAQANASNKK